MEIVATDPEQREVQVELQFSSDGTVEWRGGNERLISAGIGEIRIEFDYILSEPAPKNQHRLQITACDTISAMTVTQDLKVGNTLPLAQNDEFTLQTNAAGESKSVTCNVLSNDSDPDGDEMLSIQIVHEPSRGSAEVTVDDNQGLVVDYTSNEGHGGEDTFTYRVSDAPGNRGENDWSNVATVTVMTSTPPVALDTTVSGHPAVWNPLPPNEPTEWRLNLKNLSLRATDLNACDNASEYEFFVQSTATDRARG
ncbi:cadherin-like domain-containing protein, partial [Candidatus Bipolaricaulota bacterium]|nr:cadherin-like domain-containing protein [Candidatus Bipolaricaulota bacterium]